MVKELTPNIKGSITRSISQTFENYMESIGWNIDRYDFENGFMVAWQEYISERALWYEELPDTLKANPLFHEYLAKRINAVIKRVLTDPPTEEQIATIEHLQETLGTNYDYGCKAEAQYVERILKERQENQKS